MPRVARLTDEQIREGLARLNGWAVENGFLTRKFRFKAFMEGMAFVNKVAEVAETMNHHPDIYIRFGMITISLITHGAQGLTHLDFEQATQVEALYREMAGA